MIEAKSEELSGDLSIPVVEAKTDYSVLTANLLNVIVPKDVSGLEEALTLAERGVVEHLTGSSIPDYLEAVKVRDTAKSALKSAVSLTGDEALSASLIAHKSLIALFDAVNSFDTEHGISYAVKGKKAGKTRISGTGEITPAEYAKIPEADKVEYGMVYSDGTITLYGKNTGNEHSCRTITTLERHKAN